LNRLGFIGAKTVLQKRNTCTWQMFLDSGYLRHRCITQLTAKLTTAPMAASTAVLTTSCRPSCPMMLSRVPPVVPAPSRWSILMAAGLLSGGCPGPAQSVRLIIPGGRTFHRLQHAQRQGHVFRHGHHLRRQLQRRGDDQLACHRQRFLDPVIKCRFVRRGHPGCLVVLLFHNASIFSLTTTVSFPRSISSTSRGYTNLYAAAECSTR